MINTNGQLIPNHTITANRGFNYGDALFETIKIVHSEILFWEDHYLRLMASMRMVRMEIPMHFTMEFLHAEILKTVAGMHLSKAVVRARLTVYRDGDGYYLPISPAISYTITVQETKEARYIINKEKYTVDLFKDYYLASGLLSTLKTNNRMLQIIGSIYAKENGYDNCILLNQEKHVTEALNGNVFIVNGYHIKTPPLTEGCINGILRKQLIKIVPKYTQYNITEAVISPFELQKADELFITNVVVGIQPVTIYRKKQYTSKISEALVTAIQAVITSKI